MKDGHLYNRHFYSKQSLLDYVNCYNIKPISICKGDENGEWDLFYIQEKSVTAKDVYDVSNESKQ